MHGIKRKVDETFLGLLQYAGVQERVYVAMNRLYKTLWMYKLRMRKSGGSADNISLVRLSK